MRIVEPSQRAVGGRGAAPDASSDPVPWNRVKQLFLEALDHPDSERTAYVARVTANDAGLRREVESLLASDAAAHDLFETPAAGLLGFDFGERELPPRLAPGTQLGPYKITAFVAAGGMGAVYRARHVLLGREVAIKTVGDELPDDAARRRLLREARHASVLRHPNICAIHDVGDADGTPFIVMEYVSGKSLGTIVREGLRPFVETVEYGIQIAAALDHAHRRGIIHRDLKSSNVVIDAEGKAIVLDFGLARRLPDPTTSRGDSTATDADAFAGTLSHMAPEILRGESADARGDVWALGVLLYESLTGELPFSGRTPFETSSAILGEPPRAMSIRVPLALRLIVERCLIRDPRGRYQTAHAVGQALDAVKRQRTWPLIGSLLISARPRTLYAAGAALLLILALAISGARMKAGFARRLPAREWTLALAPLRNATGDSSVAYYADGITDALVAQLGASSDVRVLSRASVRPVAVGTKTAAEIGKELGADVVVEGTLRSVSAAIAIDVRLVRSSDGRVLWSESYRQPAREVLSIEADVVRALAAALQSSLKPGAQDRLATIRAVSPDVYEAYLKGRYQWNRRTPTSIRLAIEHFTRATTLDPTYAPAHAALADCFNQLGTVMLGQGSPLEFRPRATAEAIAALQLDPYSAEAHAALGYALHYDLHWADAEREFRRAIELNPSYALAHIWYANLLMSRLRMKEATEQVLVARDLDPYSLVINTNLGWVLDAAGRHGDAIAQYRRTLALDSTYVQARWRLTSALVDAGRIPEARAQLDRVMLLTDSSAPALAALASIEARAGQNDSARAHLAQLVARSRTAYVPAGPIALAFDALGDHESALVWIEKAFADRSNAIAYLALDYRHSPLARDPRYKAMLVRAGLQ